MLCSPSLHWSQKTLPVTIESALAFSSVASTDSSSTVPPRNNKSLKRSMREEKNAMLQNEVFFRG